MSQTQFGAGHIAAWAGEGAGWKSRDKAKVSDWLRSRWLGSRGNGSGAGTCSLEVVLAEGRRIEVRRDFDVETLARLIRTLVFGLGPATRSTSLLEPPICARASMGMALR